MAEKYEVILETLPERYIPVLSALRALGGFGLKEAKELLFYAKSNCPCALLAGVNQNMAEDWRDRLNSAGAKAIVRESSLKQPMLVAPKLDQRYQNHWFFGLRRADPTKS